MSTALITTKAPEFKRCRSGLKVTKVTMEVDHGVPAYADISLAPYSKWIVDGINNGIEIVQIDMTYGLFERGLTPVEIREQAAQPVFPDAAWIHWFPLNASAQRDKRVKTPHLSSAYELWEDENPARLLHHHNVARAFVVDINGHRITVGDLLMGGPS